MTKEAINLSEVWGELGYSSYRVAATAVLSKAKEEVDYSWGGQESTGGRPRRQLLLNEDYYKQLVMDKLGRHRWVVKEINKKYEGEEIVCTEFGTIDIFSNKALVVVEKGDEWIRGLGKLLVLSMAGGYDREEAALYIYDYTAIQAKVAKQFADKTNMNLKLFHENGRDM